MQRSGKSGDRIRKRPLGFQRLASRCRGLEKAARGYRRERLLPLSRLACAISGHAGEFILKGGTSLSKGWNLLDRFSEDLDILVRSKAGWGKSKRDTRLKTLRDAIAKAKGFALDQEDKRTRAETGVSRSAVYRYESVTNDVPGLGKNVLFEAGYRGSADAVVKRTIRSMVAEYAKDKGQQNLAEDLRDFEIELQDLRRTFVEKLFAIHASYAKDLANNRMRHYYDLSRLCGVEEIQSYVGTSAYQACITDVRGICRDSQVFLGVIEGNVRCEEADTLTRVGVDELPNTSPQDRANKDVRVENDHLSGMRPSRGDAVP
jgi:hypothetical protein